MPDAFRSFLSYTSVFFFSILHPQLTLSPDTATLVLCLSLMCNELVGVILLSFCRLAQYNWNCFGSLQKLFNLSEHFSYCQSIHLYNCLSIYILFYLYEYHFIHLPLSIYMNILLSICLYLFIRPSLILLYFDSTSHKSSSSCHTFLCPAPQEVTSTLTLTLSPFHRKVLLQPCFCNISFLLFHLYEGSL